MVPSFFWNEEFASIVSFVQFILDEDRADFTTQELSALNFRLQRRTELIRLELEQAYGLKFIPREPEKHIRGFTSSSNDRWYGPGSEKTHGGSGFDNRE